jgi:hypothetical protein
VPPAPVSSIRIAPQRGQSTDYRIDTESYLELVYKQHLPNGFSFGLAGHYQQLTGDSGSALLGDFKGRVAAIGP